MDEAKQRFFEHRELQVIDDGLSGQNEIAATAISDSSPYTVAVRLQPVKPR